MFDAMTGIALLSISSVLIVLGVIELAWRIPQIKERNAVDRAEREALLRWSAHLMREDAKWGRS